MVSRVGIVLRIAIVLAVSVVLGGRAPGAWACSCAGSSDSSVARAQFFKNADLVFVGTATAKADPNADGPVFSTGDPVTWTFTVGSVQKGKAQRLQMIRSAREGASCGFVFEIGRAYQVFARQGPDGFTTSLCSGTDRVAALAPTAEEDDAGANNGPVIALATAGILVVIGVALLLVRRARRLSP